MIFINSFLLFYIIKVYINNYVIGIESKFEKYFNHLPRWKLIVGTAILTVGAAHVIDLIRNREELPERVKKRFFNLLKRIPSVRMKIEEEMKMASEDIREKMYENEEYVFESFLELPEKGKKKEDILKLTEDILNLGKFDWKNGKISGGVMAGNKEDYTNFMVKVFSLFSWSNPLHVDVFPGIRKMECEVVAMVTKLFHGDENTIGCMTQGGSESLIMVMKAYRNWGRHVRGIENPEVIAPHTVHAAFEKGASILGLKFRKVQTDPRTIKFKLSDVEKLINKNTVMICGSAPDFSHGVVDDIEGLSKLALKYGIPLHVDCCLGGFFLPFIEAAGYPMKPFDFRLRGVTSISADTHKYGMAPKGSSVILYSKKEYLHHQYFTVTDWPGGIYATSTIPGSRSGANIAVCWAALLRNGMDGYVDVTKKIAQVSRDIIKGIKTIDDIYILGEPVGPVVSFASDRVNIVNVVDVMDYLGWHLQALQNPPGMHIYLTSLHTTNEGFAQEFIEDLRKAVEMVKQSPDPNSGWTKIYGLAKSVPDKRLVEELVKVYLDTYYTSPKELN
ncbi:UNVERIFIED_CONTAM: hypothetical protein RMT77_018782 [Armadillidium vulgare]